MKIWIDLTSLPHIHFFRALIRRLEKAGYDVLVTSREFSLMNDILEKNGIEYTSIGSHGGIDRKNKLIKSSERVSELAKFISREKPDFGMSKHSAECPRVCFGLGIPCMTVIDHETAEAAMRLMVPLSDFIISPAATPARVLKEFGARDILQFYGVCEPAHFYDFSPNDSVIKDLGLSRDDRILIARSEPMLSSHNGYESKLLSVLKDIRKNFPGIQTVFIPRSQEDLAKFKDLDLIIPKASIDTLSLYSFASLMIGAGSCMNREACIGGCPAISICPDNLPGVDKFLISEHVMWHSLKKDEIVKIASDILDDKIDLETNGKVLKKFEDPYGKIMEIINRMNVS